MKSVTIFHNPNAGDEAYDQQQLITLAEQHGYQCDYYSVKEEDYESFQEDTDLIAVAGGDGTVRSILKVLMKRRLNTLAPLTILPMGTANNISKSLGIFNEPSEVVKDWENRNIRKIDLGEILDEKEETFFLEAAGFGVFPALMQLMKDHPDEDSTEDKLEATLKKLRELIVTYQARDARVELNGEVRSGKFLVIEIMNISSIGPNLLLAPEADPGDGQLDIVLIEENEKDNLLAAIDHKINGSDQGFRFEVVRADQVHVRIQDSVMHLDDELIQKHAPLDITIRNDPKVFEFLI
ncbi:diacylglycerol/lipid kinase family protein [Dyadobacter sediminis]|nr:diacylglycerol kinase family protein [Dyadobacter sediminis]GGB97253.1 diacylglycerol kinase [Dyadobacter sediminis]